MVLFTCINRAIKLATQLDGTNKVYDVLAVVSIPSALQTPLQVDMGLDYIFPTNELLGNMVSADQPAHNTLYLYHQAVSR